MARMSNTTKAKVAYSLCVSDCNYITIEVESGNDLQLIIFL
jgi:hypothetical protein